MAPKIPTQEVLRKRELAIVARGHDDDERYELVRLDRLERWTAFLDEMQEPEWLVAWAETMTVLHGPKLKIHRNKVGWIMALLIARYGEAEYFWPAAFSNKDRQRAYSWLYRGIVPSGVAYIVAREA